MSKMKIAFDFHGVLETYPTLFKTLLTPLKLVFEIIILSGPTKDQIHEELHKSGYSEQFHYHQIISVVDWLKDHNIPMGQHKNGSWYCDDKEWWKSKSRICEEHNIAVLFDDSIQYKEHIRNGIPLFIHIE